MKERRTSAAVKMTPGRWREAMQQVAVAVCPFSRLGLPEASMREAHARIWGIGFSGATSKGRKCYTEYSSGLWAVSCGLWGVWD